MVNGITNRLTTGGHHLVGCIPSLRRTHLMQTPEMVNFKLSGGFPICKLMLYKWVDGDQMHVYIYIYDYIYIQSPLAWRTNWTSDSNLDMLHSGGNKPNLGIFILFLLDRLLDCLDMFGFQVSNMRIPTKVVWPSQELHCKCLAGPPLDQLATSYRYTEYSIYNCRYIYIDIYTYIIFLCYWKINMSMLLGDGWLIPLFRSGHGGSHGPRALHCEVSERKLWLGAVGCRLANRRFRRKTQRMSTIKFTMSMWFLQYW